MNRQHWFKAVLSDWPVTQKNCETILYLNFNPSRATWKTRDYSLTWLTLALIMGCAAQQQASCEVPHPPPPPTHQKCVRFENTQHHSAPMWIQSLIPPINEKKSLLMLTELRGGCVMSIITLSSSFLSASCFHSLINILHFELIKRNKRAQKHPWTDASNDMQKLFQRPVHNAF